MHTFISKYGTGERAPGLPVVRDEVHQVLAQQERLVLTGHDTNCAALASAAISVHITTRRGSGAKMETIGVAKIHHVEIDQHGIQQTASIP